MRCPVCHKPNPGGEPATPERRPRVLCAACGYDSFRSDAKAADLTRPHGMGTDEWEWRTALYLLWRHKPASELLAALPIFADWLAERGRPEEAAARADWRVYGAKKTDPAKWWQWTVPVADGWVRVGEAMRRVSVYDLDAGDWVADLSPVKVLHFDAAQTQPKPVHNGAWFLCWPPGSVRFTAPLHHDPSRYRVTIGMNRPRRRYESVHPHGYATLFHPPGALRELDPVGADGGPTLFDEVA